MRTFISIDIPEQAKQEIKKIQDQIPKFFGKRTELENLHLTLKFFGEIDEKKIEKIRDKLREIKYSNFEAEIDSIGVFSEKFIRIVWLHISGCEELQKMIDEKLKDLFEKEIRFMSHLTIARVKNIEDKKEFLTKLREIKIPKIKFTIENFSLKESILRKQGPVYKVIEEYGLEKYR
jgi:2'-5' RNA ligase